MKQLFLTSSVDEVVHDLVKHVDFSKGNKLVFILTAAEVEHGDKQWVKDDRQALIDAGFEVTDYTITNKTESELRKDLDQYQFIYVEGGNTFYLLQQSQKSGFILVIQDLVNNQEKVYIGTSAGSIIAGPKLPEYLIVLDEPMDKDSIDADAYNFVNFTILPHWGSVGFRKKYLESRMETAYKIDQVPLVLLTDSQYVHVKDDWYQIIEVKK